MDLMSRVLFVSFVGLLGALGAMYTKYPDHSPRFNTEIFYGAFGGVAMLVVIWRGVIARRKLSIAQLYRIDLFYMATTGLFFGASTTLAYDFPPAGYSNLLYTCFMCMVRASVVPSSARRTLVASVIEFVPMLAAAVWLALNHYQDPKLPGDAFVIGGVFAAAVVTTLSTISSRTVYDLRQKVSRAKQLGQYTLDRKIGEGGMGTVYRARHALLARPTAIKLLQPDKAGTALDRFEREVQHMSQLSHPNTVAVFDYGHTPEGQFYYAMEYLPGIDLQHLVQRYGPQPAQRVIHILAQVCGALHEAHGKGLIHRDIKPGNIILCERGGALDVAKVVDFGLVSEVTSSPEVSSQTILGTLAYLAPEAITDPARLGPAADLYALGAVGYFLLTGKLVFDGKPHELLSHHVRSEPLPPSRLTATIPAELEQVILACLAKQPNDRPSSAAVLQTRLRAIPDPDDWSDTDAAKWWETRHGQVEAEDAVSDAQTITVTIDLDDRRATVQPLR